MIACQPCNHLKGKLTLGEFREALALRLSLPAVVFAGEATPDRPATQITSVRSLAGNQDVTKLDPLVGERLDRALVWLRLQGRKMNRKDAVSTAVTDWLDGIADTELAGAEFPAVDQTLPFEGLEPPPVFRPGEASKTPRQVWQRDVTRIDGRVLDEARRAVALLAQHDAPMTLMDFVTTAVIAQLDLVEASYPHFAEQRSTASDDSSSLGITAQSHRTAGE